MADERRVLSVGLDLSEKENKNEIKIKIKLIILTIQKILLKIVQIN